MKLLHTSDWHLGRVLHGRKRYDEYEAFLNWLAELIESEDIDVLLVAASPNRYAAVKEGSKHSFACRIDIDYNHVKFRSYPKSVINIL